MERRIHVLNEACLFIGQLALRMKRDAIYDIMGEELALQDYLSEELREFEFDEDDSVDCLRYSAKVLETLNKAYDHIEKGVNLGLSDDERQMTDLLVGFAPHNYDSRYVALGKEAAAIVSRKMKGKHPEKMKEAQRIALAWDIMDDIEDEAQRRGIEFDKSHGYCFELMYVGEWLEHKFRR